MLNDIIKRRVTFDKLTNLYKIFKEMEASDGMGQLNWSIPFFNFNWVLPPLKGVLYFY